MEILQAGIKKSYIGMEASCKHCYAVVRIEKKDEKNIVIKGTFKQARIKCPCGGWLIIGENK